MVANWKERRVINDRRSMSSTEEEEEEILALVVFFSSRCVERIECGCIYTGPS